MSIVSALYEPPPLYTCCGLLSLGSGMLGPARERGFSQPVVLREPWADFAYRISFLNGASGRRHLLHTCAAVLRAHHLLHHAGRRGLVRDEAESACLKSLTRQLSGPGPAGFVSVHSEPSGGWSRPLTGIVSRLRTRWVILDQTRIRRRSPHLLADRRDHPRRPREVLAASFRMTSSGQT